MKLLALALLLAACVAACVAGWAFGCLTGTAPPNDHYVMPEETRREQARLITEWELKTCRGHEGEPGCLPPHGELDPPYHIQAYIQTDGGQWMEHP